MNPRGELHFLDLCYDLNLILLESFSFLVNDEFYCSARVTEKSEFWSFSK